MRTSITSISSLLICASVGCADSNEGSTPDTRETTNEVVPETTEEVVPETTEEVVPETTEEVSPETTAETTDDVAAETTEDVAAETNDVAQSEPSFLVGVSPLALALTDACFDVRIQAVGGDVLVAAGDPGYATDTEALEPHEDTVAEASARGAWCQSTHGGVVSAVEQTVACTPGATYDLTFWVHNIYDDGTLSSDWLNPCGPEGTVPGALPADWQGDCTVREVCPAAGATRVTADFTIMRRSNQGFFDIAVDFEDTFCTAKVDTCYDGSPDGTGGGELVKLLFNDRGERVPTAVVATACASSNDTFAIYSSDITLTCEQDGSAADGWQPLARTVVLDASVASYPVVADMLVAAQVFRGVEALGDTTKVYQNFAIALDNEAPSSVPGASPGNRNCRVTMQARAADSLGETTVGFESSDEGGRIETSVRLTDAAGAFDCRAVPLGSNDFDGADYDVQYVGGDWSFCTRTVGSGADAIATRSTVPRCN